MRWILLIVLFIFVWAGMEVYCNMILVRNNYALQKTEQKIEQMEKENGSLKRTISSYLSLKEIEAYAREKLNLGEPQQTRYIQKEVNGKEEKPFFLWVKISNWFKELESLLSR